MELDKEPEENSPTDVQTTSSEQPAKKRAARKSAVPKEAKPKVAKEPKAPKTPKDPKPRAPRKIAAKKVAKVSEEPVTPTTTSDVVDEPTPLPVPVTLSVAIPEEKEAPTISKPEISKSPEVAEVEISEVKAPNLNLGQIPIPDEMERKVIILEPPKHKNSQVPIWLAVISLSFLTTLLLLTYKAAKARVNQNNGKVPSQNYTPPDDWKYGYDGVQQHYQPNTASQPEQPTSPPEIMPSRSKQLVVMEATLKGIYEATPKETNGESRWFFVMTPQKNGEKDIVVETNKPQTQHTVGTKLRISINAIPEQTWERYKGIRQKISAEFLVQESRFFELNEQQELAEPIKWGGNGPNLEDGLELILEN
jgi:hypothetical protein